MVEFRSLAKFLNLIIQFTASLTQHRSFITVRVGDEATLPCEDVKDYQDKCFSTTWTFIDLPNTPAVPLFEYGKIHREAASKSDRLSATEKCSLVIKKVSYGDVGLYTCRQFISGQKVTDSQVELTVIKKDNIATTKLPTTTKRTTKPTTTTKLPKTTKATTRPTTTDPAAAETNLNSGLKAVLITVAVLAAFLIIIVAVIRWKKAKGYNTQLDDNTDEPPDGVSYASIRYKKKTKNKTRVQGEDDTVTYSTINISSTSAGASTDPRNLYASINKTNR